MGYERFYLELHDHPNRVEALLETLTEQLIQTLDIAVRCDATALQFGGNYDEMMTPPPIFARFFAREETFALGVCNGCQMLSHLKELIPGAESWPRSMRRTSVSVIRATSC